jgi:protein-S-isoprenylcysteine O-methyltransferase Ste14
MFWLILYIAVWGVVHSWLASLGVKDGLHRRLGEAGSRLYRLAYNVFSVATFAPILLLMRRLPDHVLYTIPPPWLYLTLTIQGVAALCLLASILQTGALAFIGLKQLGGTAENSGLVTGGFYRYVRHPMYFFGLVILWLTPIMTINLLMVFAALTVYLLVGAWFEERKLHRMFGAEYAAYKSHTPMLIPLPRRFQGTV